MFENLFYPGNNQIQNPYLMNQNYQQIPRNQFISKQVSNIEEARAYIVDPFSTYLFIDTNAGKIYMKRMNNNGLSDFFIFSAENINQVNPLDEINRRLTNIENIMGGKNVQSVSDDAKSNTDDKQSNDSATSESESTTVSKGSGNDQRKK